MNPCAIRTTSAHSRWLVLALTWIVAGLLGAWSAASLAVLPGLAAAFAIVVMLLRAQWIPSIVLAAAMFVPFGIETGTQSRVPISLLVVALALVLWMWTLLAGNQHLPLWRGGRPIIGFMITCAMSWLIGRIVLAPSLFTRLAFEQVQLAQLVIMLASPLTLLLAASVLQQSSQVKAMVGIFLLGAVLSLLSWLFEYDLALFINDGGMFSMWAGVLSWSLCWTRGRLNRGLRLLCLALFLVLVYRFFFKGLTWFSGWVPLGVAVLACSVLRSPRLAFPVALGFAGMVLAHWDIILAKYSVFNVNRPDIWRRYAELFLENPIFGTGPASYALHYTQSFAYSSHNNYLDILTQTGIVGFMFYLWIFVELLIALFRGQRRTRDPFTGAFLEASIGAVAGLAVAMMQGDWLIPFVYNQTIGGFSYAVYSWLFFGAALALCLKALPRESASEAPASVAVSPSRPSAIASAS
jgi:O-antigen ligase